MDNSGQNKTNNKTLSLVAEYGASDSDSDDTETRSNEHTGTEDSDAADLSEMVLKNNIINACAHGPIARANPLEVLESTSHMIIDPAQSGVTQYEVTEFTNVDSSSSSDSDSEVDSVKDVEEVLSGDEGDKAAPVQPKVTGELGLDELPPIEDLAISLPAEQTIKIGTIASIVDRLVIVRALPETPAVDLDTVLFLENGAKTLGKVFDVFGPVTEPHYCVRFNSTEHVAERGVAAGMDVFLAPRTPHTTYVFVSELMKIKGSDASWLNDIEAPPHQVEYSDDEEERRARAVRKEHNRQQRGHPNSQADNDEGARQQDVPAPPRTQPVAFVHPHGYPQPPDFERGHVQPPGVDHGYVQPPGVDHGYVQPPGFDYGYVQPPCFDRGYVQPPGFERGYAEPPGFERRNVQHPDEGFYLAPPDLTYSPPIISDRRDLGRHRPHNPFARENYQWQPRSSPPQQDAPMNPFLRPPFQVRHRFMPPSLSYVDCQLITEHSLQRVPHMHVPVFEINPRPRSVHIIPVRHAFPVDAPSPPPGM